VNIKEAISKFLDEFVALEPCYGERGGNSVCLYTRDGGSFEVERKMLSLLKNIAVSYNASLALMRKNYGQYLDCGQNVPLPFSPYLVLVPIKMRQPECENDGATGYVNLNDVIEITTAEVPADQDLISCHINLKGGHSIPSLFSEKNTKKRLKTGRLALDRFLALQNSGKESDLLPAVLEGIYNQDNGNRLLGELISFVLKTGSRE